MKITLVISSVLFISVFAIFTTFVRKIFFKDEFDSITTGFIIGGLSLVPLASFMKFYEKKKNIKNFGVLDFINKSKFIKLNYMDKIGNYPFNKPFLLLTPSIVI